MSKEEEAIKELGLSLKMDDEEELNILLSDNIFMPKMYSFTEVRKFCKAAYTRALDDNRILHGDDAQKFLEQVYNPMPMSDRQKKFLDECTDLFESSINKREDKHK